MTNKAVENKIICSMHKKCRLDVRIQKYYGLSNVHCSLYKF